MSHDEAGARRRWLPAGVLIILVVVTVAGSALTQRFVDDQEQRLLDERASEAAVVVSSLFSGQTATLPLLGALVASAPGAESTVLARLVPDGAPVSVGVAGGQGDGFVVEASAGARIEPGDALSGDRLAVVERAAATEGIVSSVSTDAGERRLVFAVAIGDGDRVLFQELSFDPEAMLRTGADESFSELDGAVYVSDVVDEDRLLFANTDEVPVTGDTVERTVRVGGDEWLLVVKQDRPLVGDFASHMPWYVLAGGLVGSVLVAALVEVVNRRRAYALRLVDTRTAELRDALAEKEQLAEGQRRARELADEANLSKSEFLSRMSHELRTPLNAVLGFAQLLETEDLGADNHDAVRQILKGGRHLLELINEVLDITRIETGSFQLSPEPVLVREVVDDVVELTRPLAAAAELTLETTATPALDRYVLADRQRLNQVLLNLVSNAVKYNRRGGTVSLSCELIEPAAVRIRVRDTGPGIREEHLDMLFTPFERLGAEHTSIEGTGIGLALSRRLAEAMGGTIDLETTVGAGTTFWVELPVVEGPVERYSRLNGDAPHDDVVDGEDRTVLYIEDNLANLRLVERIFANDPRVRLVPAGQGGLGVDLAREHRPDLILLDLHLPDIGGDVVLRQLRDDPATASIPVVMVSADATAGQIRRLLAEGAHAYITKPIDVAELRRVVDDLPITAP